MAEAKETELFPFDEEEKEEEEIVVTEKEEVVTEDQPSHEYMEMPEFGENVTGYGLLDKETYQSLKSAFVDNPWEQAEIYENIFGDDPRWGGIEADKYNNPIVKWNDTAYYINRPGLSTTDIAEVTAEIAKYAPVSKWVGGAKNLLGRVKRGALGYSGTELASEAAENIMAPDTNRRMKKSIGDIAMGTAIPTGIGVAADIAVPPALRIGGQVLKGAARKGVEQIGKLSAPRYQPAVQKAADAFKPKEQITSKYPLTVGQKTGDLQQLKSEDLFRRAGPDIIRNFDERQLNLIIKDAEELRNVMGSGDPLISQADDVGMAVGERVQTIVSDAAENLKSQAKSGYNFVKELDDTILDVPYSKNLGKNLVNVIKNEVDADTLKMLPNLSNVLKRMEKLAKTGKFVTKKGSQNVNDLWSLQKQLNVLADNAGPGRERAIIGMIKRQLDGEVYKGIDSGFISGNADILQNLKNSTGMYAQYMGLTGESWAKTAPEKKANLILKKLTNTQYSPREVVESLFGHAKFNTKGEMKLVLEKLNKLIPEEQMVEVKALMKDAILTKAFTNRTGKITRQGIINNFDNIFVKNKFIVDELFSPDEILKIKSFRDEVMPTLAAEINTNPSGTAFTLVTALENMGLIGWTRSVPFIREVREGMQEIGERARMIEATRQFMLRLDNPLFTSVVPSAIGREVIEDKQQEDIEIQPSGQEIEFNSNSLNKIITGLGTETIKKLVRQL
tara:strand:- start:11987 stop:14179 length:2193 start_codon:yes stop_codon:yes gene_type:complete